jgi:predicted nucleic acid-binding protein
LIYLIEGNSELSVRAKEFIEKQLADGAELITSALAVGEVLVKPIQAADLPLVRKYNEFFESGSIKVVPFDQRCAPLFARLRAAKISAQDSIQLACASQSNVDLFVTNDSRLRSVIVPNVQMIVGLQTT